MNAGEYYLVIESRFWREDLAVYCRSFKPKTNPARWSERVVVNFEKDITIALFMVRRLAEAGKFSSKMMLHRVNVFRCAFHGKPHRLFHKDIDELYKLEHEEAVSKDVMFICNQFIHADLTYAYRGKDRNWEGLYTSSDFEKRKWLYKVPLIEIRAILHLAIIDAPTRISRRYDDKRKDWVIETD